MVYRELADRQIEEILATVMTLKVVDGKQLESLGSNNDDDDAEYITESNLTINEDSLLDHRRNSSMLF